MGTDKGRDAILEQIARPKTRSPLFWWLLENHDLVQNTADGRRLNWGDLCLSFAAQGMTDRNGKAPTETTARQTWWRVRNEKKRLDARRAVAEAERAAKQANDPRRKMPSRMLSKTEPPLAAPPKALTSGGAKWSEKYKCDELGFIRVVDGMSAMARTLQNQNLSSGYPRDRAIEQFIGNREE